jgi:hypothetical protein
MWKIGKRQDISCGSQLCRTKFKFVGTSNALSFRIQFSLELLIIPITYECYFHVFKTTKLSFHRSEAAGPPWGLLNFCRFAVERVKTIVILNELCTRSVGLLNEDRSHRRCYCRRSERSWHYLHLQGQQSLKFSLLLCNTTVRNPNFASTPS